MHCGHFVIYCASLSELRRIFELKKRKGIGRENYVMRSFSDNVLIIE
jgi:hypothetical protein